MDIDFRLLIEEDVPDLMALFGRVRPTIAKLKNQAIYRAVVVEALARRRLFITVALLDGDLVGYSIVAWDWNRFRIEFLARYPRVIALAGATTLRRKLKSLTLRRAYPSGKRSHTRTAEVRKCETTSGSGTEGPRPHLRESGPDVALVIHVGVDPKVRSRGIGSGLKGHYVEHLKSLGIRRVEAWIDDNNAPSLAMHRRQGWTLVALDKGTLAYLDIASPEGAPR